MNRIRPLLLPAVLVALCIAVFAPLTQALVGHYWLYVTAILMGLTVLIWNIVVEKTSKR